MMALVAFASVTAMPVLASQVAVPMEHQALNAGTIKYIINEVSDLTGRSTQDLNNAYLDGAILIEEEGVDHYRVVLEDGGIMNIIIEDDL